MQCAVCVCVRWCVGVKEKEVRGGGEGMCGNHRCWCVSWHVSAVVGRAWSGGRPRWYVAWLVGGGRLSGGGVGVISSCFLVAVALLVLVGVSLARCLLPGWWSVAGLLVCCCGVFLLSLHLCAGWLCLAWSGVGGLYSVQLVWTCRWSNIGSCL